jgi:hypothetical protein
VFLDELVLFIDEPEAYLKLERGGSFGAEPVHDLVHALPSRSVCLAGLSSKNSKAPQRTQPGFKDDQSGKRQASDIARLFWVGRVRAQAQHKVRLEAPASYRAMRIGFEPCVEVRFGDARSEGYQRDLFSCR